MSLSVRRYKEGDHDAVWVLHNLALNEVNAHGGNGDWDADVHRISEVYLESGGEFLVGEVDGEIVAMGGLMREDERSAKVRRMRVHPEHQRQGYGQAIMDALLARAKELGIERLWLDTTRRQLPAQRFYLKNGFRQIGSDRYGPFELLLYELCIEG